MPTDPAGPPGPVLIGRKELVDFPEWGLRHVRVKVDTGAHTSALDADCEIVGAGGRNVARLRLALYRRRPGKVAVVEAPLLGWVTVCNSGGCREQRPVVEALVRLGPVEKRIRLTVANRAAMRYPVILGREALAGSFLVDVSRSYVQRGR